MGQDCDTASIQLDESSYGACRSAYVLVTFKSLSELTRQIRDRRWRRHGDNPGQAYMGSCKLVHIHTSDYGKTALLLCSTSYDI